MFDRSDATDQDGGLARNVIGRSGRALAVEGGRGTREQRQIGRMLDLGRRQRDRSTLLRGVEILVHGLEHARDHARQRVRRQRHARVGRVGRERVDDALVLGGA